MISVYWFLVFLIVYPYLVYPFLLMLCSRLFGITHLPGTTGDTPDVAVVISAFNEEKHIVARIENLLQQTYPEQHLTIYIGCDGCNDRTAALVREMNHPRVVLFDYPKNRGKISVLNDMLSEVTQAIVVLSDANTYYKPDAIQKLLRHFEDQSIGGVCGELHLYDKATGHNQDGLYWKLEQKLKFHEARLNAYLGANGAIYAIRRKLFKPLPEDTITDDFTLFMQIALEGHRTCYDVEAVAEEEVAPDVSGEYGRRVRIGTGNYQAFFRLLTLFQGKQKWRLFTYVSHKVIRWFTPQFMVMVLILNLLLLDQWFYQLLLVLQILLYSGAYVLMNRPDKMKLPGSVRLAVFFVSMNLALGHGFIRFVSGRSQGAWSRTQR